MYLWYYKSHVVSHLVQVYGELEHVLSSDRSLLIVIAQLVMSVAQAVQVTIQLSVIQSVLCENHINHTMIGLHWENMTVPKALLLSEYLERQNSVWMKVLTQKQFPFTAWDSQFWTSSRQNTYIYLRSYRCFCFSSGLENQGHKP